MFSLLAVQSLLADFIKLVASTSEYDGTFVERKDVCYVYEPIEYLNLVLVIKKQSNTEKDFDTLRLLYKLVSLFGPDILSCNLSAKKYKILL